MYITLLSNGVLLPVIGTICCFLWNDIVAGPIPPMNRRIRRAIEDEVVAVPYGYEGADSSIRANEPNMPDPQADREAAIVDTGVEFLIKNDDGATEKESGQEDIPELGPSTEVRDLLLPQDTQSEQAALMHELLRELENDRDRTESASYGERIKRLSMSDAEGPEDIEENQQDQSAVLIPAFDLEDQSESDSVDDPALYPPVNQPTPYDLQEDLSGPEQDTAESENPSASDAAVLAAALDILSQRPKLVRQDAVDLSDEDANELLNSIVQDDRDDDDEDKDSDDDDKEEAELQGIKESINHLIEEKQQRHRHRSGSRGGNRKRSRRSSDSPYASRVVFYPQDGESQPEVTSSELYDAGDLDANNDAVREEILHQYYAPREQADQAVPSDAAIALGSLSEADLEPQSDGFQGNSELDSSSQLSPYASRGKRSGSVYFDDDLPASYLSDDSPDLSDSLPWNLPYEPDISAEPLVRTSDLDEGDLMLNDAGSSYDMSNNLPEMQFDSDSIPGSEQYQSAYDFPEAPTGSSDAESGFDQPQWNYGDAAPGDGYPTYEYNRVSKRGGNYPAHQTSDGTAGDNEELSYGNMFDDPGAESQEASTYAPIEWPSPEADDLPEAVAGRYRVCDMVRSRFHSEMGFTGTTLEVDECFVTCERREEERVFKHIFKLVDWPCGNKLEGTCGKDGSCSAF